MLKDGQWDLDLIFRYSHRMLVWVTLFDNLSRQVQPLTWLLVFTHHLRVCPQIFSILRRFILLLKVHRLVIKMSACTLHVFFNMTGTDTLILFGCLVVDYIKIRLCVHIHILRLCESWETALTAISCLDRVYEFWYRKTGDVLVGDIWLFINFREMRTGNNFISTFLKSSNAKLFRLFRR